tara:strand:+ start:2226 stop:2429 length:204 start_codon:yes stop_codon:yes gene_type:complete
MKDSEDGYDAYISQEEPHNFLPGFIKQFDPEEGELISEEWKAIQFLRWLNANEFKIVKTYYENSKSR